MPRGSKKRATIDKIEIRDSIPEFAHVAWIKSVDKVNVIRD